MFGIKIIKIADNEKALLFRHKSFLKVLEPGRHVFVDPLGNLSIQVYDVTVAKFEHRLAKFLAKTYPVLTGKYIDVYETGDTQVGLVFIDGKFEQVLAPASFIAFWKEPAKVSVEIVDIAANFEVDQDKLALITHAKKFPSRNTAPGQRALHRSPR